MEFNDTNVIVHHEKVSYSHGH